MTCARPGASILYWHSTHPDPTEGHVVAASLGDIVHQLCEAYDAGLQSWDPRGQTWIRRPDRERRGLQL